MHHRVDVHELGDNDPLSEALARLVWYVMNGGVRHEGEKATIMIPSMRIGPSEDKAIDSGKWEIVVKKVED